MIARFTEAKRVALRDAAQLNRGLAVPEAPLCLYLEISNVCNFKCAFCASFSAINPKRFSMLKQSDRGFLDVFENRNVDALLERALTVYLFGFGEPTMHPDFANVIRHVGAFETQIEFVTNGMLLNEELSRILVESRVRQVMISFSGSTKSDYENLYLNGDFETVLNNMARLDRIKKETGSRYPVILINSIAFKHHLETFPDFVDLMGSHGASIINLNNLVVNSAFPEMFHHARTYVPARDDAILEEARRRAEKYGVILGLDAFVSRPAMTPLEEIEILQSRLSGVVPADVRHVPLAQMQEFASQVKAERPKAEGRVTPIVATSLEAAVAQLQIDPIAGTDPLYCMEPFRVAYIRRDGNVMPCCLWPNHQQSFGNIATMSGTEIWNSPAYELTRNAIRQNIYPSGCEFCVKSRVAPEDAQLWQATSFVQWYREGFGIDLSDAFPSEPLRSAQSIISGLNRNHVV